jgi:steroid delta-isomerase-like uncharacterized protein
MVRGLVEHALYLHSELGHIHHLLAIRAVYRHRPKSLCHRPSRLYGLVEPASEITAQKEIPAMQDNSTIVRHFIEEVINQGQIDSAVQFVWEDVVEQVPFPGQGPGLEGLKDILRAMRTGFPDLYFSVEEQIAEGDKVLTRFEWTGTHRGEFLGVPATGRSVKVWGMVIDQLQSGRIKDTRIIMDSLGLMMQLGVFPPPRA